MKSLRTRIRKARSMQDRPQLGPDLRARLQETFLADRDRLARLFPAHPALTDAYPFAAP